MTTISAQVIAHSKHAETTDEVACVLARYPRIIHAEVMTHRVFSRNAASSRALPIQKLIAEAENDPAVPLYWGRNQKGMQAAEELTGQAREDAKDAWHDARRDAIKHAKRLAEVGAHKQTVNRLLEPFTHITVVISSTQWTNFQALRDHAAAEPHIRILAQRIKEAMSWSRPDVLQVGDWHLPFIDPPERAALSTQEAIWVSTARLASTSYKTVDGFDMTIDKAKEIHAKLAGDRPMHASPMEHPCQADALRGHKNADGKYMVTGYRNPYLHGNFRGFIQYRKTMKGECL